MWFSPLISFLYVKNDAAYTVFTQLSVTAPMTQHLKGRVLYRCSCLLCFVAIRHAGAHLDTSLWASEVAVTSNKAVMTSRPDCRGRSEFFMTAEAIKVIWAAVATHHHALVRMVLLYWLWRGARSCLCPCSWQAARIHFFTGRKV